MAVNVTANEIFTGWVVVACLDNNGKVIQRTKEFEIADTITLYADALAAVVANATALDNINEADIIEYGVRTKFGWNGTVPTVVGNVYKEAVLTLIPAVAGDKISHTIFSPDDTLAPSGGGVNTGDAELATYLAQFMTAGDLRMSDGEAIASASPISKARIRTVASKEQ